MRGSNVKFFQHLSDSELQEIRVGEFLFPIL